VISIVTPSLNQGQFLESAIRSVVSQDADVEYVVVDGGSDDDSVAILERQERGISWTSEPDGGQFDALNKGFSRTTGEIMGWLNADDFYVPNALAVVDEIFREFPEIEWVTSTLAATANERGAVFAVKRIPYFDRRAFMRGYNLPYRDHHAGYFVPQESTFWRRTLWERAGARLDESSRLAGDFELWSRFCTHADLWGVHAVLGVFRTQPAQRSRAYDEYVAEAERALERNGGRRYSARETSIRRRLARHATSTRVWRLPTPARASLERHGLYATRELMWMNGPDRWAINTNYFV